jgi:hypothetical protein
MRVMADSPFDSNHMIEHPCHGYAGGPILYENCCAIECIEEVPQLVPRV